MNRSDLKSKIEDSRESFDTTDHQKFSYRKAVCIRTILMYQLNAYEYPVQTAERSEIMSRATTKIVSIKSRHISFLILFLNVYKVACNRNAPHNISIDLIEVCNIVVISNLLFVLLYNYFFLLSHTFWEAIDGTLIYWSFDPYDLMWIQDKSDIALA